VVAFNLVGKVPLPANPGNTTGTYSGIALTYDGGNLDANHAAAAFPGSVKITVDANAQTYTLTVPASSLPINSAAFANGPGTGPSDPDNVDDIYVPKREVGFAETRVPKYSDGSTSAPQTEDVSRGGINGEVSVDTQTRVRTYLGLWSIGQSAASSRYVSLGSWLLSEETKDSTGSYTDQGPLSQGYFVFGERTAPGDLPASGTATYHKVIDTGDGCGFYCYHGFAPSELSVDFGVRTISAAVNVSDQYNVSGSGSSVNTATVTSQLSGTAPIGSAGDFSIAMSGTGTISTAPNLTKPLTGLVDGAFFGPQAAELGGVYKIENIGPLGEVKTAVGAFTSAKN
jgi:hypothetical protein